MYLDQATCFIINTLYGCIINMTTIILMRIVILGMLGMLRMIDSGMISMIGTAEQKSPDTATARGNQSCQMFDMLIAKRMKPFISSPLATEDSDTQVNSCHHEARRNSSQCGSIYGPVGGREAHGVGWHRAQFNATKHVCIEPPTVIQLLTMEHRLNRSLVCVSRNRSFWWTMYLHREWPSNMLHHKLFVWLWHKHDNHDNT